MFAKLISIFILSLAASQAFAGASVTYHGRILKADGSPLEAAAVAFKIQVRSPGVPSCLLYEETRTLNMLASNGVFAIPIGDGNGVRTPSDPAITIENVFSNNIALNFTGLACNSGSSYNPASLDSRRLVVSFDDASGSGLQLLAPMDINYVPLALHTLEAQTALKVGSTPAANVMTVSGPASALSPSNFTELLALVNGTSTTYAKTTSSVGGDLSGTIASANVVKLQGRAVSSSAPSTSDVLTWNGSAWAPAAGGGGGAVSSVAGRTGAVVLANTDISGLGNSSTKNVGTAAGTVAAGDDARFGTASTFTGSFTGDVTGTQSATVVSAVGGSTAANVHNAELLANSATSANTASTIVRRDASGDFVSRDVSLRSVIFKDSGSKSVTVLSPTALTNSYTLTWPLDKGALNQVLTTDASGNLFWSTPAGGGGGGTVTSVTSGGAPLVVTGTPTDPIVSVSAATTGASGVVTLAIDNTTVASTVVQATDSRLSNARVPNGNAGGDLSSTYPNPTVSGIKGAAITYTSLTSGDFLKYNGSAWVNVALSSANLSDATDLLKASHMPANCSAGSSLTFSSPSGTWVCTTIPTGTTAIAGIVQLASSGSNTAGRVVEATDSRLTDARAPSGNAGGDLSSTFPNPTVSKINNVGLSYTSLTSGDYLKYDGTNWVNSTLPAGGLTNFTESANNSAPNATVPVVQLLANNAATNVDVALSPKGTGAITAHLANSATSGGNKRGAGAVDWQTSRSTSTQVASGLNSTLSGGLYNTASGMYSTVSGGGGANATGIYSSIGGGGNNTASGMYSRVSGGESNVASGDYSSASNDHTTAESYGQTTIGRYNMPKGSENSNTWVTTDPLFVVGNGTGTAASRSTALMILKNGNVGIGTTTPTAKLHIGGTAGVDGIKFPDGTTQTTAATGGGISAVTSGSCAYNSGGSCTASCPATYFRTGCSVDAGINATYPTRVYPSGAGCGCAGDPNAAGGTCYAYCAK